MNGLRALHRKDTMSTQIDREICRHVFFLKHQPAQAEEQDLRPRSLSEYWGAVANRGLASRARGERRTAMAPIEVRYER